MSVRLNLSTPRVRRGFSLLGASAVLFSLGACVSSQTGGEIDRDDRGILGTEDQGLCKEVSISEVEPDQQSELGLSAQDLIDIVEGTHTTTLSWAAEDAQASGFTVAPEAGEGSMTIVVRTKPETAVLVDLEREPVEGEGTTLDEPMAECRDELRVDAEVTITSDNGAFNDTFDVTFSSQGGVTVRATVPLEPGELQGSFDVSFESDNASAVQTALNITFAFGSVSGDISGLIEETSGSGAESAVTGSWALYGRFPTNGCEDGIYVEADSDLGKAFRDSLSAHSEFSLDWSGGESSQLTLVPTVGKICYHDYGSVDGSLYAPVSAEVTSEDGRINATWDLSATGVVLPDGSIGPVTVAHDSSYGEEIAPSDFEATTGIAGVVSSADTLGFTFNYQVEGGAATGALEIFELVIPACAQPGYEPEITEDPDGGMSSPGCEGTSFVTIESASFQSIAPSAPAN